MKLRNDIESEIKKAENPYEYYTDELETFRGRREDKALINAFLEEFRMFKNEEAIIDPDTLMRFAEYASKGSYDLLYCDDDVLKNGTRTDPFFKPEYAPETVESYGLFFDTCAVRRYIDVDNDGWYKRLDPKRVKHIPEVLSHYMEKRPAIKPEDDSAYPEDLSFENCSLSIIILSKDHPELLEKCVQSICKAYLPYETELIVVDNGSTSENRARYRKFLKEYNADYFCKVSEFNYSALCNFGAKRATGEYLLFLNDDIEIPEENNDFAIRLIYQASKKHAGASGIKLLYPGSNKIQHCGVTLLKSGPSHKLCGFSDDTEYYFGLNKRTVNMLAVTGACMCIKRELFEAVRGFDEALPIAYNDVDLCVRLYERGLYNICINSTFLYHHESASRKDDRTDLESYLKMREYRNYFYERHSKTLNGKDPFYNKNLTETGLGYDVNVPGLWELSGVREKPLYNTPGYFKTVNVKDGLRYNIDSAGYRLSDAYLNEDFFEISGWIFFEKKDLKRYEPGVMISLGEKHVIYDADRVYREDVGRVFGKQKNACMAGFHTRISHTSLEQEGLGGELDISPVLIGKNGSIYIGE